MSEEQENLFPTLGDIASRTNALPDVDDDDKRLAHDAPPLVEQEEGEEREIQEVESLCMRCHEQGVTRLLLTSIPYFKEIVVSSFRCDQCGHRDTEIQSAGEIQRELSYGAIEVSRSLVAIKSEANIAEKGVTYTVHILHRADLDRQLVKSNFANVLIPDLQLTIPSGRGQLSTVEGIIRDTIRDLKMNQPVRKVMDPETAKKIDEMLDTLRDYIGIEDGEEEDDGGVGQDDDDPRPSRAEVDQDVEKDKEEKPFKPFRMTIDDPTGNSFFQFHGSASDPQWNMRAYNRTLEQNVMLGLVAAPEEDDESARKKRGKDGEMDTKKKILEDLQNGNVVPEEVFSFPSTCSSCGHELETLMQQVSIPYFQNIIIMATNCFACGYRDNEIKAGSAISDKGKKITLKVEDEEDLTRDLLKSDTAGLEIPEIDLVLQPGTLGGRFTTLEGLLNEIYTELSTKVFRAGDSSHVGVGQSTAPRPADADEKSFETFLRGLKDCISAATPFTLILDDPVANSYLQNLYAPDPDPNMTVEEYERTHEQNEELGLNDILVEGYEQKHQEELEAMKTD